MAGLSEYNKNLKTIMSDDKVDVSSEKAKLSAKELQLQMLQSEHRQRRRNGEPVGTFTEWSSTRNHEGR